MPREIIWRGLIPLLLPEKRLSLHAKILTAGQCFGSRFTESGSRNFLKPETFNFQMKPSTIRTFLQTWNFLSFFPLYFGLLRLSWSGSTDPIEFGFDHWFRLAHALLIVFKFIAIVEVIRLFAFFLNYLRCIPLPTRDFDLKNLPEIYIYAA